MSGTGSHLENTFCVFVISDGCKADSALPLKAAVKRKQQRFLTNSDTVKHRRSAADNALMIDELIDRSVECFDNDRWTDTQTKAVQLQLLLDHERKQSNDFEAYLRQVLSDSQTLSPSDRSMVPVHESCDKQCSLTEKMSQLQSMLTSEHEADRLFELQLLQICLYD